MIIKLNSNRRIVGTARAWELQRLGVSKGKSEWRPFRWFYTLAAAVHEAAAAEIRTSPVEDLVEALDAVRSITERYENSIDDASREMASRAERKLLAVR